MTEHPEIAVLMTAKSSFDAQVVAGVLRESGIPCFVGGEMLTDPVAVSQRLANTGPAEIQVPADQLEAARAAIRKANAAAHLLDDPSFDPGPRPDNV